MNLTVFLILISTIIIAGGVTTSVFAYKKNQSIASVVVINASFIVLVGVFIIIMFSAFHQNMTTEPNEWRSGTFVMDRADDGSFIYRDIEDKQIKKANISDKNMTYSWTTSDTPVIYKAKGRWGFLYNEALVYCYPNNSEYSIAYNNVTKENNYET